MITNGGAKPNIIPELAELEYYIRAPTDTELVVLKEKVVGCIEGAATATGCKVNFASFFQILRKLIINFIFGGS